MIRLLSLILFIVIGAVQAFAQNADSVTWDYSQFSILRADASDPLPTELRITNSVYKGWMPKGSATHPIWGVEQVFSDKRMTKRLFVKRDVQVTFKGHSGWMKVGKGFVLHLKQGSKLNAFYALGFDTRERFEIERQLRGVYKTVSIYDALIPQAFADEVVKASTTGTPSSAPKEKEGAENEGSEGLAMCIGKMSGQIVGNKVSSAYHTTVDAVSYAYNDKVGAAKAVGSYVAGAASSAWDTTKSAVSSVGSAVAHPVQTWDNVAASVDSTRRLGNEIYAKTAAAITDFPTWPQPVRDTVSCVIAAELIAGGAELVAGFLTGAGESMAAIRAAKLLASLYERIKGLSSTIRLLIAAKETNWSARLSLLKEMVKGNKTAAEVEVALHKAGTTAEVAKDSTTTAASKASDLKSLSPDDLAKLQAKNRALGDTDRIAAIEKQLGLKSGTLTDEQKRKLLDIHNKPCAKTECTAQEIKDLKDLKVVKEMFPDVAPQNIKDLYRANLLGSEKDEFASLLKSSLKPRAEVDEGAQLAAHLESQKAELASASADVAKLHADTDHSPIAMADAQHREQLLKSSVADAHRDVTSHELKTAPPRPSADDHEFKQLLKSSFKPRDAEPSVAHAAEPSELEKAREARHAQELEAMLKKREAAQATKNAAHTPPSEADLKEFNDILKKAVRPHSTAAEKMSEKLSYASKESPIEAKYVSAKTGEVVRADVIGLADGQKALDAEGGINHAARVLVRTTGEDGRTVTREVALKDLAFGKDGIPIGAKGGAHGVDAAVDRIVEKATSSTDRIQELKQQSSAAYRAGDTKAGGVWDRATTEHAQLMKQDQPLTHAEIRHINAVHEAFTPANIASRMPLQITKDGGVIVRTSGSKTFAGFTDAEKHDLKQVKSTVESRNHSPKTAEDKEYFEKVKNLDEKKIVLGRFQTVQAEAVKRMREFTGGTDCCAFPRNAGFEYQPKELAKAYGANAGSIADDIKKVQTLVSKPNLTSLETSTLRDQLGYLRRKTATGPGAANLNRFLDYLSDRAGYERLSELRAAFMRSD